MDDDVTVESSWLQNLTANLQDTDWAGAGGRILPERSFSPPPWLSLHGPYSMGGVLALFDRGDKPGELDWVPFGTNMAFRKSVFDKYGEFRTDLGRRGDQILSGEDTEFGHRLVRGEERLRYEPLAVVYHAVPENRLRKSIFWHGISTLGDPNPGKRARARHLGNAAALLQHSEKGSYIDGDIRVPVDGRHEPSRAILQQGDGLVAGWANRRNVPAREPRQAAKRAMQRPQLRGGTCRTNVLLCSFVPYP